MSEYNCPECKDTGEYRGLNTVEPCRACGGNPIVLSANEVEFTVYLTDAITKAYSIPMYVLEGSSFKLIEDPNA